MRVLILQTKRQVTDSEIPVGFLCHNHETFCNYDALQVKDQNSI